MNLRHDPADHQTGYPSFHGKGADVGERNVGKGPHSECISVEEY